MGGPCGAQAMPGCCVLFVPHMLLQLQAPQVCEPLLSFVRDSTEQVVLAVFKKLNRCTGCFMPLPIVAEGACWQLHLAGIAWEGPRAADACNWL